MSTAEASSGGVVRAGVYVRISKDKRGDELGVRRQEKECRLLCGRLGWEVAEVYVDNDLTAYKGPRRPAWQRLLDDLRAGRVDAVAGYKTDRFYRQPRELEDFIDIVEQGGHRVATAWGGPIDLSSADGRAMARVVGAFNRMESEVKSERVRSKHAEIAQAGRRPGGGTRPFGYIDSTMTLLDADEAALVREAAERVLRGESVRGVCADWSARGVTAVRGGAWAPAVLRRLLVSPTTAGMRSHRGRVVAPGTWPPLLDEVTHHRLRAVLLDPARRKNALARRYLLAGLAECSLCGARLVARPRGDKRRCYVCASGPGFGGCGRIRSLSDPLEHEVVERVLSAVDDEAFARGLADAPDDEEAALAHSIAEVEAGLAEMSRRYFVDKTLTAVEYEASRPSLVARLESLQRRLARLTAVERRSEWLGRGAELRAEWEGMTLDQRRAVLSGLVERVVVAPAVKGRNFFDPERVVVRWRG